MNFNSQDEHADSGYTPDTNNSNFGSSWQVSHKKHQSHIPDFAAPQNIIEKKEEDTPMQENT